jgi:hypothetical protein
MRGRRFSKEISIPLSVKAEDQFLVTSVDQMQRLRISIHWVPDNIPKACLPLSISCRSAKVFLKRAKT